MDFAAAKFPLPVIRKETELSAPFNAIVTVLGLFLGFSGGVLVFTTVFAPEVAKSWP